ncbi:Alb1-domain-containing protein [Rhypophila decipiens]|uniref:Alb1-domain-containing protein n=1 Tax=Rhypophila decipiens TaxID=261697 RepID=A0AAN7BD28_9PEZI|nr:Alb1-domain-containing protein [Rhypophila decipiens]
MAKGGISKGKRGPSIHSRAARRETSPSINTDKSLKFVTPPQDPADKRPTVLGAHHNGGVTKSSKRKQRLSSKQRRRQEKSMDKAEAIMDRTVKKVEKSKGQAKVIYSRRRTWEEVNSEAIEEISGAKPKKMKFSKELQAEDEYVRKFLADDGDEEMEEVDDDNTWAPAETEPHAPAQVASATAAPPPVEEEHEIL